MLIPVTNERVPMQTCQSVVCVLLISLSFCCVTMAQERKWSDASGLYNVAASFVTLDKDLVVLKQADGELVVLRRNQLSAADQEYLRLLSSSKLTPQAGGPLAGVPATKDDRAAPPTVGDETVAEKLPLESATTDIAAKVSRWRLRGGEILEGNLVGFGQQTFTVSRDQGRLLVNGVELAQLPKAYELIVPAVVSKIDNRPIANYAELEKHIADGRGGPFD